MSFIWPIMLLTLFVVPLLAALYIWLIWQRRRLAASYRSFAFGTAARGNAPGVRRHIPAAFFLAGLIILLIALARPQTVVSLPSEEGTVILAFDVSGSMAADDLKPTRIAAARTAAQDFVQRMPRSVQIGVVAFSDNGFTVQAPTDQQESILAAINRLTPERGTSLAQGILGSLDAIAARNGPTKHELSNLTPAPMPSPEPLPPGTYTSAVIVLLTDGENNMSPDPLIAARTAADRGVRIYTVGIGSTAGSDLHINGFTIHSQLDEAVLQQVAQLTGGTYYNAVNEQDLRQIYDHLDPQLIIKSQKAEVTSIFAGASMFLLLLGGAFSLSWFGHLP